MNCLETDLPERMWAALATRYGGPEVIEIMDVPLPTLKAGMLMVRVEAATVNSADARTRGLQAGEPLRTLMRLVLGLRRPRQPILGTTYAGTVVAVDKAVTDFKIGDRVFGSTPGMSFGCHAQYVAVPQNSAVARIPEGADPGEIVSLVFGGATALFFLKKAGASPGTTNAALGTIGKNATAPGNPAKNATPPGTIGKNAATLGNPAKNALIYGASGAVGSMAVQIARNLGMRVTGVAGGKNEELVLSLGADLFLNYTRPDFRLPQAQYDLVFDAVGKLPKSSAKQALKPGGVYVTVGGASVSKETRQHMERLAGWYVSGDLKPVIHERLPFDDIREAHRIVDTGHKRGNVILFM